MLLLRRALGHARPEDYVEWAVDSLCDGADGPNLRILAGLSTRFDRDEIEHYFRLTCAELRFDATPGTLPPLQTALLIRKAYERGDASAVEAVHMMADLYQSFNHSEELLAPWLSMSDGIDWKDDYFYPPAALASLDDAVRREWSLLDRAITLCPPHGWLRSAHCVHCGHVGDLALKPVSVVASIVALVALKTPRQLAVCAKCGSARHRWLGDPDARSAYLDQLEQNLAPQRGDGAA
jgi:hypothetical protein